jgi:hypothetical protein
LMNSILVRAIQVIVVAAIRVSVCASACERAVEKNVKDYLRATEMTKAPCDRTRSWAATNWCAPTSGAARPGGLLAQDGGAALTFNATVAP